MYCSCQSHLNFAVSGKGGILKVEPHASLILDNLACILAEAALVWRANDARVPIEMVVAVIDGSQHRLTLRK